MSTKVIPCGFKAVRDNDKNIIIVSKEMWLVRHGVGFYQTPLTSNGCMPKAEKNGMIKIEEGMLLLKSAIRGKEVKHQVYLITNLPQIQEGDQEAYASFEELNSCKNGAWQHTLSNHLIQNACANAEKILKNPHR
jgi:hypothetical protein